MEARVKRVFILCLVFRDYMSTMGDAVGSSSCKKKQRLPLRVIAQAAEEPGTAHEIDRQQSAAEKDGSVCDSLEVDPRCCRIDQMGCVHRRLEQPASYAAGAQRTLHEALTANGLRKRSRVMAEGSRT